MDKKKSSVNKSSKASEHGGNKSHSKHDFLVVGLGASAGGVRALQDFFATMPPNSGMAFVVILHLNPHQESNLTQIIQTQTEMPVMQVAETVKVEPNKVYVIPPNRQLEMVDGVIRSAAVDRVEGQRIAIDVFFRTLAEAYEKNAVCVVLSGTGSDGTLGLKRVKESNGFAIVQDPADAEYDSMPRSAIETQLADWILPVRRMPEKLIQFRESSERLHLTNGADAEKVSAEIRADESLREILTLLRVRTGHDFANYKTPTLVRRIARHLQIHELEDISSYLELLRNNPDEIQSLLKNLLINVTNFFRDKEAFDALEKQVIPNLFAGKTGKDTVRVWSAGCASGEEAYSLAMLLNEFADTLTDPPKFQVFASDVDDEAIQEAREHLYPESIEADVSPERLKRFFVQEGSFFRIKKELRETVLFAPHNVLRDPPFSRLDLVSCRNLLIYLNRDTQERVLQIFHFALAAHGYLFLGSSETAESVATLFAPVDKKNRIYSRRAAPLAQNALPLMPVVGRWEVRLPDRKTLAQRDRAASLSEIHYKLLENYAPSSVLVNQDFDIVYLSGSAGKFLRFSGGEPSRNLLKAINPELLPDLRAALFTAQREHKSSEFPNVRIRFDSGEEAIVNLIVRAVDVADDASDFLLVIFEEKNSSSVIRKTNREIEKITDKDEAMETVVRRLEEDLQRTKEHLRFTIEQHETSVEELKASNEELQAINEELRSASEELETSKEELQSVNEELTTLNQELKENIDETGRINSDLSNLMAATDIATIFLDKNLRIKRYTPPVQDIFNITLADVARPLEHFTHKLNYDDLAADAAQVLKKLAPIEREITDRKNRFYLARFVPYRTIDDWIDGVVLNFIDITERHQAESALRANDERIRVQKEAFQAATSGAPLAESLNILTQLVVKETAGEARTAFYIADLDSTRLYTVRGGGDMPEAYADKIDGFAIGEDSLAGALALPTGQHVLTRDVFEDPRWKDWTLIAEEFDYRGCWSFPIKTRENKAVGTFAMYFRTPREATPQDISLAEIITQSAAIIISNHNVTLERARAEEALRASEEKYRIRLEQEVRDRTAELNASKELFQATMDATLNMIQVFEAVRSETGEIVDFRYILLNHDAERWIPGALGKSLLELQPGVVEEGIFQAFKEVVETGVAQEYEKHYVHEQFDGWFHQSVVKLNDGVVTTTATITDRKKAEQQLLYSQKLLQATIDAPNIGIAVYQAVRNKKGKITDFVHEYINRASLEMLGEDFTGKLFTDHGENGRLQMPQLIEVIETGKRNSYLRKADFRGRRVWFAITNTPLDDERLVHTWEDVTERRNAEAEILQLRDEIAQKATDKYRTLFETIDEGFCVMELVTDENGQVADLIYREANPAFEHHSGLKNVIGKRASELVPNLEQPWLDAITRVHQTGVSERMEGFDADLGRWLTLHYSSVGGAGSPFVTAVFNDITERKEREREREYLLKLADALRPLSDAAKIQAVATETALDYFAADRCFYAEIANGSAIVRRDAARDDMPSLVNAYPPADFPIFKTVLDAGTPFIVGDVRKTDLMDENLRRFCLQMQIVSLIYVPIIKDRQPAGILCLTQNAPRDWTNFEIGMAIDTAERIWATIKRARSEEALRASEELLRIAAAATHMYSWEFDAVSETYKFSDNAADILGVAPERLPRTQTETFALVHPDDRSLLENTLHEALTTGKGFALDFRTRKESGETIWLSVQATAIKNIDGRNLRVIGTAQDITARRRAEELLFESEERMRIAIEAGGLGTWEWDIPAGRVIWNDQHFKLFGMKPNNLPVKPEDFFYHVHPDDRESVREQLNESVIQKTPFEATFRAVVENEGVRWMHGYGRVIETDETGNASKMSGVMFDITIRKRAEESLRKSEEQLQLILESTKDYAIITFDLKGFITRWNAGAQNIFGFTEKEAVGRYCAFLFTPEDQANDIPQKEMQTALVQGRAEDERWHIRKDGSRFFASGVMQPLKDGELEGFVKIARDQTQRILAEANLRDRENLQNLVGTQEDERRRIARDIHDHLGQTLTALRLRLDALKTAVGDDPVLLEHARAADQAAAELDANVDFIAWELRPASLDDLGLPAALANFVSEWAKHTGIATEFHSAGLGRTRLDYVVETNLYRIGQEALNNIWKHAGAGKVSVLLEKSRNKITLIVEDDGVGFSVADKSNRRKGIGLVGMDERAKLCGGALEIESAKGKGTTVFARVPLKK